MITLRYEYDPDVWLPVPTSFPDDAGRTVEMWAAQQAARGRERGSTESTTSTRVDDYFVEVANVAREHGQTHDEVWLAVAADAPGVVLLVIDVIEAEGSLNDLVAGFAATADNQYEPAAVVPVDALGLGQGCYVMRNDIAEDRTIYVTVNFVFRIDGFDIVIATQSYDTVRPR
jgi:hypothetical protein